MNNMDSSLDILKENNQLVGYPESVLELNNNILFRSVLPIDAKYDIKSEQHRARLIAYDKHIRDLESLQNQFLVTKNKKALLDRFKVKYEGIEHTYYHNVTMELINLYCLRGIYIALGDYPLSEILNVKSLSGINLILDIKRLVIDERCSTQVINTHIDYIALNMPEVIYHIENNLNHFNVDYDSCIFKANRLIGDNFVANISRMGQVMGTHIGASTDLIELVREIRNNDRINEMVHSKIETAGRDMPDIEAENKRNIKEGIDLLANTNSNLGRLIKTGTGVKTNEVYQEVFALGNRPSMSGMLYPYFINESFVDGLSPLAYFIQSNSSRKFQQINAAMISKTGYTQRIFNLAFSSRNKTYDEFCGTVNPLHIIISSIDSMKHRYLGRNCFIYDQNGDKQEFYIPEDAEHIERNISYYSQFINRDVFMYSPLTCAHDDGYCSKCLGFIHNIKYISHASYCGTVFSAQLGNKLLGTKHLIVTHGGSFPNIAGFPTAEGLPSEDHKILQEIFVNDGQFMVPRPDRILSIDIIVGDIKYNSFMPFINELQIEYVGEFGEVKKEVFKFYGNNIIYLSTPLENFINYKRGSNSIHHVNMNEFVDFNNAINNNTSCNTFPMFYTLSRTPETIDTVRKVQNIIFSSVDGISIADMYSDLLNAMEVSKISFNSTHVEMVLSIIISSSKIKGERPNFKRKLDVSDYRWINIRETIKTSATSNQLGFEDHMKSVANPASYDKHLASSNDVLFTGTNLDHLRKVQTADDELLSDVTNTLSLTPEQLAIVKKILTV